MPGIFGIIDTATNLPAQRKNEMRALVERMSAAMEYENFYSAEIVSALDLGACVGRVGLPALSGSREPVSRPSLTLVTAGEPRAEATGFSAAQSDNDLEAIGDGAPELLRTYQQAGEDGFADISGGFSGFLIDRHNSKCLLFNDRYGMERLFVHRDGSSFLFSSEAKAILAVAPRTRSFDAAGLADFLALGCTLGTRSLFSEIEVLEGGTVTTFTAGGASRRRYFDRARLEALQPLSERDFLESFGESLKQASNHAVKQAPGAGISLTGGLDTRMIMASLEVPPGSVPCYTFSSMYRTTYDVAVSKKVAAACGQPHQELELDRRFFREIAETLDHSVYVSDGYLGLSGATELYLNRQARSIAPARVTGNWGGEMLRGVRAFKCSLPKGNFCSADLAGKMTQSAETFAASGISHPLSYALFYQMPVGGYSRYSVERSQVRMRAPFLANAVVKAVYQAPHDASQAIARAAAIIGRRPELLSIPTDVGTLGGGTALSRRLRRVYRRAIIKAEYMTSHGAPDWMAGLSSALPSRLLETRFLGRDKFQHFRFWIRKEIGGFVRETLLANRTELSNWFDMARVEAMLHEHIAGRANYTDELDKLMTVAVAGRKLLKALPLSSSMANPSELQREGFPVVASGS